MAFTAKDVANLRAKTGAGMIDCKKALTEAEGDFDQAVKILREKGISVAAKKADRIAAEGVVDILVSDDGKSAAIIEVNAETDFVAKNETFKTFVKGLLATLLNKRPATVDEFKTQQYLDTDFTVESKLKDMIFTIGENMNIRRYQVVDGIFSTYIHGQGTTGVIISFDADETAVSNPGFPEFAKNIALQVAAMAPLYLSKETVPQKDLDEEKEIIKTQIQNDEANAKKPEAIIEKMVLGRINKFYEKNCLLEQAYVKEDDLTVGKYVAATAKEFGGKIAVTGFISYEKGEGLQKREEDFAAEIEKMVKQ